MNKIEIISQDVPLVDVESGEIIKFKHPLMRSANIAMQIQSKGESSNEPSLFVPNQALDLNEILSRSARGMSIPIVTREGVYISESIDDEIDILEKMDKDLTDYTKALLKYRHQHEQRAKKAKEIQSKKDELYNDWIKSLNIKKDNSQEE